MYRAVIMITALGAGVWIGVLGVPADSTSNDQAEEQVADEGVLCHGAENELEIEVGADAAERPLDLAIHTQRSVFPANTTPTARAASPACWITALSSHQVDCKSERDCGQDAFSRGGRTQSK